MEFLKQWTVCVCAALIIAVIFSLFEPKGKMKNFYKVLISIFIFISFLYPFRDFKGFSIDFDSSVSQSSFSEQNEVSYELMIENRIKDTLISNGIENASVICKAEVDYETGELLVSDVEITVSNEYSAKQIEEIVYNSLGIKARVVNVGA